MKEIAFYLTIMLFMRTVFVNVQTKSITGIVTFAEDKQIDKVSWFGYKLQHFQMKLLQFIM